MMKKITCITLLVVIIFSFSSCHNANKDETTETDLPAASSVPIPKAELEVTSVPTPVPTAVPTVATSPTSVPTVKPTAAPSPTIAPTAKPTIAPSSTKAPTIKPTATPTPESNPKPTLEPTIATESPTPTPIFRPSLTRLPNPDIKTEYRERTKEATPEIVERLQSYPYLNGKPMLRFGEIKETWENVPDFIYDSFCQIIVLEPNEEIVTSKELTYVKGSGYYGVRYVLIIKQEDGTFLEIDKEFEFVNTFWGEHELKGGDFIFLGYEVLVKEP